MSPVCTTIVFPPIHELDCRSYTFATSSAFINASMSPWTSPTHINRCPTSNFSITSSSVFASRNCELTSTNDANGGSTPPISGTVLAADTAAALLLCRMPLSLLYSSLFDVLLRVSSSPDDPFFFFLVVAPPRESKNRCFGHRFKVLLLLLLLAGVVVVGAVGVKHKPLLPIVVVVVAVDDEDVVGNDENTCVDLVGTSNASTDKTQGEEDDEEEATATNRTQSQQMTMTI
mmetsp:Transcript_22778/g.53981  ORF Transcript_22778/g.53981 Transcript_22778/m.53981 type:complete len:231 (+) Transcript_22778:1178-1870(+)